LLKRERDKGAYQTSSYFLSFTTVFLPQHIVLTFIYCGISYFMVNLRESADAFFVFTCTTMLIVDAMFYIAFLFSAVSPSVEAANLIFSIGLIFWITFSGYFVHPDEIPGTALRSLFISNLMSCW
jgi:ABC-type multidrug transport system permease subunit